MCWYCFVAVRLCFIYIVFTCSGVQSIRPSHHAQYVATMEGGPSGEGAAFGLPHIFPLLHQLDIDSRIMMYLPPEQRSVSNSKGAFCKNLFLKDRKGQFYLGIVPESETVDLRALKSQLRAHRNLSFGCPGDMKRLLGVSPGGVTPFGLLHDSSRGQQVRVAIATSLTSPEHSLLNFHPLDKRLTLLITFTALQTFLQHCGYVITFVDM